MTKFVTETIDRLFLELSHFTDVPTHRELELEAENKRLRRVLALWLNGPIEGPAAGIRLSSVVAETQKVLGLVLSQRPRPQKGMNDSGIKDSPS